MGIGNLLLQVPSRPSRALLHLGLHVLHHVQLYLGMVLVEEATVRREYALLNLIRFGDDFGGVHMLRPHQFFKL